MCTCLWQVTAEHMAGKVQHHVLGFQISVQDGFAVHVANALQHLLSDVSQEALLQVLLVCGEPLAQVHGIQRQCVCVCVCLFVRGWVGGCPCAGVCLSVRGCGFACVRAC